MRAEAVGPSPTARVRVPTVQRHRATAVGEAVRAASDSPAGCPTAVGQGTRAGGLLPAAPASGNPPGSRFGNLLGASPASRSSTGSRRAPCEGRRGNLREDVEQAVPASGSPPSPMRPACPNRYGKRLARRLRLAVAAAGRRARLPWADGGGGSRRGNRRVQAVRGVVRERQVSAASARVRADRLWAVLVRAGAGRLWAVWAPAGSDRLSEPSAPGRNRSWAASAASAHRRPSRADTALVSRWPHLHRSHQMLQRRELRRRSQVRR